MKFPKSKPYRNKKHLINVAMMDCQVCGASGPVQASHSNWSHHGKSMARKADDQYTAAICQSCHYEIDQGSHLTKEQRQEMWTNAWISTVRKLVKSGDWPLDIPEPEEAK